MLLRIHDGQSGSQAARTTGRSVDSSLALAQQEFLQHRNRGLRRDVVGVPGKRAALRCMLAPYAVEGISTWLQRLDRFAQVVERTKGDR
jgi:hypothetical protein